MSNTFDPLQTWKREWCAACGQSITVRGEPDEIDDHYEIVRKRPGEKGTGESIFYHEKHAPFGNTSIRAEFGGKE